jgi:hypothetical protein
VLLVLELPVVEDAANRRLRGRSDLYEIELCFLGAFQSLGNRHDADL